MSYYIRKITRAKWPEVDLEQIKPENISADAITGCIRTTSNKLSLWKVENTDDNLNNILPLITGFDKPNRCEFVYISEKLIKDANIDLQQSSEDANTIFENLNDTHYNAVVNDYKGLGVFAEIVVKSLGRYVRISEREVKDRLIQLIETGTINKKDLKDSMLMKLGYQIAS